MRDLEEMSPKAMGKSSLKYSHLNFFTSCNDLDWSGKEITMKTSRAYNERIFFKDINAELERLSNDERLHNNIKVFVIKTSR